MNYAKLINSTTINALLDKASEQEKADLIAEIKHMITFTQSANFSFLEILEDYLIYKDSHTSKIETGILINAIYTLKNNMQIENDLAEFIAFQAEKRGVK